MIVYAIIGIWAFTVGMVTGIMMTLDSAAKRKLESLEKHEVALAATMKERDWYRKELQAMFNLSDEIDKIEHEATH